MQQTWQLDQHLVSDSRVGTPNVTERVCTHARSYSSGYLMMFLPLQLLCSNRECSESNCALCVWWLRLHADCSDTGDIWGDRLLMLDRAALMLRGQTFRIRSTALPTLDSRGKASLDHQRALVVTRFRASPSETDMVTNFLFLFRMNSNCVILWLNSVPNFPPVEQQ